MNGLVESDVEPEAELGDREVVAEVLQIELEDLGLLADVDGAEDGATLAAGQRLPGRVDRDAGHRDLKVGLVPERVFGLAPVQQAELQKQGPMRFKL